MRVLYAAVILALLVISASATPTNVFTAKDSTRLSQQLLKLQGENGLFDNDVATTYSAVAALNALGVKIPRQQEACKALGKALSSASELDAIYNAVQALVTLQCSSISVSASQKSTLQKAVEGDQLGQIHQGVIAALSLIGSQSAKAEDFDFSSVGETVTNFMEDDGTFRGSKKSKPSAYNAALAIELLANLATKVGKKSVKEALKSVAEKVENLLQTGGEGAEFGFPATSTRNSLSVTARVLLAVSTLTTVEKTGLSETHLNQFATYLTKNKYVQSAAESRDLILALQVCASNSVSVPLAITLKGNQVRVTNVLDKFATNVKVTLKKATLAGEKSSVSDQVLQAASSGGDNVAYNLPSLSTPGVYSLSLSVEPASGGKFPSKSNAVLTYKVHGQITGASISLSASKSADGSDVSKSEAKSATYPQAFSGQLKADINQYLHAKITVQGDVAPSQVFLELVDSNGQRGVFSTTKEKDQYVAHLEIASTQFQASLYGSGDYTVNVIVGSRLAAKPLQWKAGTVTLGLGRPGFKASQKTGELPEIQHIFQKADSRPNALIALIFTVVVALPFVNLIKQLFLQGNYKLQLPSSPTHFLYAVIFQGSIAAILASFVLYWLRLNIFYALALLGVLGSVAVFSGHRALKAHNAEHQHKHKSQ